MIQVMQACPHQQEGGYAGRNIQDKLQYAVRSSTSIHADATEEECNSTGHQAIENADKAADPPLLTYSQRPKRPSRISIVRAIYPIKGRDFSARAIAITQCLQPSGYSYEFAVATVSRYNAICIASLIKV